MNMFFNLKVMFGFEDSTFMNNNGHCLQLFNHMWVKPWTWAPLYAVDCLSKLKIENNSWIPTRIRPSWHSPMASIEYFLGKSTSFVLFQAKERYNKLSQAWELNETLTEQNVLVCWSNQCSRTANVTNSELSFTCPCEKGK